MQFLLAKTMRYALTLLLMLLFLLPNAAVRAADAPANLTVLADPNLALPLTQIARDYTRDYGTAITVVLTDGRDAAQQIGQGLDANMLVTANRPLLNRLSERGLTDVFSKRTIARTQLALVAPPDVALKSSVAKRISFTAILYAQPNLPLYVLSPDTYEGSRSYALMESDAYSEPLTARTVTLDSRDAIVQRLKTEPGFALLLAADALNEDSLKVLILLPEDVVRPVNYTAVLIANDAMEPSRDFIKYLQSPEAQMVFSHYGFQPPVD